jgi:putative radical SAM enzyme (TIGR03279 family)
VNELSVIISDVKKDTKCYKKGIRGGDSLLSINGNDIVDRLDFDFYCQDEKRLVFKFELCDGRTKKVRVNALKVTDVQAFLGIEFETYLMEKQHHCKNNCIFCFIDQLPKGLRKSLYFKDDDSRLSFLFGNYITLTNITEHEIERIIKMHISPVNISVHTMNPELRVRMMKNPNAGECLKIIDRFAEAGIKMNTQLVLCPGINDGIELLNTLVKLSKLYPSVQSIAAVPVGLTDHRDGLEKIEPYTPEQAAEVIDIIEHFGNQFKMKNGTRLAYAADEFYLKAQRPMPDNDFYEDYPQLDNGVGMWTLMKTEFTEELENISVTHKDAEVSFAVGVAAYPLFCELSEMLESRVSGLKINVYSIENRFFGKNITVSGLITGQDLIAQLKDKNLGSTLFISSAMIKADYPEKSEGVFLDDITLAQAEKELNISIVPCEGGSAQLIRMILEAE